MKASEKKPKRPRAQVSVCQWVSKGTPPWVSLRVLLTVNRQVKTVLLSSALGAALARSLWQCGALTRVISFPLLQTEARLGHRRALCMSIPSLRKPLQSMMRAAVTLAASHPTRSHLATSKSSTLTPQLGSSTTTKPSDGPPLTHASSWTCTVQCPTLHCLLLHRTICSTQTVIRDSSIAEIFFIGLNSI